MQMPARGRLTRTQTDCHSAVDSNHVTWLAELLVAVGMRRAGLSVLTCWLVEHASELGPESAEQNLILAACFCLSPGTRQEQVIPFCTCVVSCCDNAFAVCDFMRCTVTCWICHSIMDGVSVLVVTYLCGTRQGL